MKNIVTKVASALMVVGILAVVPGSAKEGAALRVKFQDHSAHYTRDIPANGSLDFVVPAQKAEKLGIQMGYEGKASDIKGFLTEPGLQDISLSLPPESRKEFKVKTSGDHRLTVSNQTPKKVTFTLYLDLY